MHWTAMLTEYLIVQEPIRVTTTTDKQPERAVKRQGTRTVESI